MDASEARSELVIGILSGKIKKPELERQIRELEDKYGSSAFTSYAFQRKPKPWSEEDYKELKKEAITGAGSKEFLLYLYEVKSSIEDKNDGIQRIQKVSAELVRKHPLVWAMVALLAVIAIVCILKMR